MKRLIAFALTVNSVLALSLMFALAGPAHAQSEVSAVSAAASMISGTLVAGSPSEFVKGSGEVVVDGLEMAGASATVVLKDISNGAQVSLRVASRVLTDAGVSIGSAVHVAAEASGYALTASGKLIAFIPNEAGKSLLGSSPTSQR